MKVLENAYHYNCQRLVSMKLYFIFFLFFFLQNNHTYPDSQPGNSIEYVDSFNDSVFLPVMSK